MHALAGMTGLVALAWLLSEDRRGVPWRAVGSGLVLELVLAVLCLKLAAVKNAFMALNDALLVLERATEA
jgi:CNT family concentrative nucleoside transporter